MNDLSIVGPEAGEVGRSHLRLLEGAWCLPA
jgi:hypothetical protein